MTTLADIKAEIADALSYEPETGKLFWKSSYHTSRIGTEAGSFDVRGYLRVELKGRSYKAHRLAWTLHYGEWPVQALDHINGIRSDNRIANLRQASFAQNAQNTPRPSTNTSGFHGVCWNKRHKKWRAHIRICGRGQVYLGSFDTPEAANAAYLAAKREYHLFQPVPRDIKRAA